MTPLTTPIFVNAKGDVQLYESVREAELAMEPEDVANGEFTIYDSRGLVMIPRVDPDGIHVHIDESFPAEERPQEFVTVLQDFLVTVRRQDEELVDEGEDEIRRMDLNQLISLMRSAGERGMRRRGWWRLWKKRSKKG